MGEKETQRRFGAELGHLGGWVWKLWERDTGQTLQAEKSQCYPKNTGEDGRRGNGPHLWSHATKDAPLCFTAWAQTTHLPEPGGPGQEAAVWPRGVGAPQASCRELENHPAYLQGFIKGFVCLSAVGWRVAGVSFWTVTLWEMRHEGWEVVNG